MMVMLLLIGSKCWIEWVHIHSRWRNTRKNSATHTAVMRGMGSEKKKLIKCKFISISDYRTFSPLILWQFNSGNHIKVSALIGCMWVLRAKTVDGCLCVEGGTTRD